MKKIQMFQLWMPIYHKTELEISIGVNAAIVRKTRVFFKDFV